MPQWLRARAAPRLLPSLVWLILAFGAVTYTLEVFFSMGHLTWVLCAVSFVLNGVSLILHLVHGALKRRLAVDRVIVCVNVASLSAAALMRVLDARVVGQRELKEALVLSLCSKEHLYVEGPPGIGKTALAEAAVRATGRSSFFAQGASPLLLLLLAHRLAPRVRVAAATHLARVGARRRPRHGSR